MNSSSIERYDRQIRLWGQPGQTKCSSSKICLINADPLGIEILKGLCLAGIGSFTILDSHRFTQEDIGCSFIQQCKIGRSRGEAAKAMILDINDEASCEVYPIGTYLPHVSSQAQQTGQSQLIVDDESSDYSQFWKQFNCVIASGSLHTSQIIRLSKLCWTNRVPLIQGRSIGFYGYLKNQIREHFVSDTHPEWVPANRDPNEASTVVITTKPIYEEYGSKSCNINGEVNEDEFITEHVCLRALDLFFSTYGRLPGCNNDQVETDISKLKDCVKRLIGKSHNIFKTLDQCLYELSRYGGAELHVTSAFMGGCIAQEAIKIITNQYEPVDDTLVYSAMTATTRAFKFNDIFLDTQ